VPPGEREVLDDEIQRIVRVLHTRTVHRRLRLKHNHRCRSK
jgi:hypothetical protein